MATITPAPAKEQAAGADKTGKGKGDKGGKGGKKKLVVILLVLLLGGGGAYMTVLKPKAPAGPPQPGAVLKLDPVTMNLADGHYLKLTMALQFTAAASAGGGHGGGAEPDGSKALDLAISQLSNRKIAELNSGRARAQAKERLRKAVEEAYHHEVMDIYFTEFVMQ